MMETCLKTVIICAIPYGSTTSLCSILVQTLVNLQEFCQMDFLLSKRMCVSHKVLLPCHCIRFIRVQMFTESLAEQSQRSRRNRACGSISTARCISVSQQTSFCQNVV